MFVRRSAFKISSEAFFFLFGCSSQNAPRVDSHALFPDVKPERTWGSKGNKTSVSQPWSAQRRRKLRNGSENVGKITEKFN